MWLWRCEACRAVRGQPHAQPLHSTAPGMRVVWLWRCEACRGVRTVRGPQGPAWIAPTASRNSIIARWNWAPPNSRMCALGRVGGTATGLLSSPRNTPAAAAAAAGGGRVGSSRSSSIRMADIAAAALLEYGSLESNMRAAVPRKQIPWPTLADYLYRKLTRQKKENKGRTTRITTTAAAQCVSC